MSPKEYNQMVEHLASEIVDSAFEKEAAPRLKRIKGAEKAYSSESNKKLLNAEIDRDESRIRRAEIRAELKKAKVNGDADKQEQLRNEMSKEKRKKWRAIGTQANPINFWGAKAEHMKNNPTGYFLPTNGYLFDANAARSKVKHDLVAARSQKTAEEMIVILLLKRKLKQDGRANIQIFPMRARQN
jgi:hypothetical protein